MIILLNRFQYNYGEKKKVLTTVTLDFTIKVPTTKNDASYELYALIVHSVFINFFIFLKKN
jgi:hypothetical protein